MLLLKVQSLIFDIQLNFVQKGILSLNNATGTRVCGLAVAVPPESIIRLVRDIILLIPSECRQILNVSAILSSTF